jgi:transcriptional regulator with XRE-family HTH domain
VLRRLVEQRKRAKRAGLRQVDVAERMGVSKARVSHIERGSVATMELLARYLEAIGGRLEITAAFDGRHRTRSAGLASRLVPVEK